MNAEGGDGQRLTQFGPNDLAWTSMSLAYPVAAWQPQSGR
jgi:hypothetical protein